MGVSRLKELQESIIDHQIDEVNRYIQGERVKKSLSTRREREDVSFSMIHLINDVCGVHSDGITVGEIFPARHKREKKRRARYWKKANTGEIIDTRRGFDKYRKPQEAET